MGPAAFIRDPFSGDVLRAAAYKYAGIDPYKKDAHDKLVVKVLRRNTVRKLLNHEEVMKELQRKFESRVGVSSWREA